MSEAVAPSSINIPPTSTVTVAAPFKVIVGSSLSSTVITVEQVSICPLPSSTVHTTVVSPNGSTTPAIVADEFKSFIMTPLIQLSVKVASNSVPTTV